MLSIYLCEESGARTPFVAEFCHSPTQPKIVSRKQPYNPTCSWLTNLMLLLTIHMLVITNHMLHSTNQPNAFF